MELLGESLALLLLGFDQRTCQLGEDDLGIGIGATFYKRLHDAPHLVGSM